MKHLILFALILAACGGQVGPASTDTAPPPDVPASAEDRACTALDGFYAALTSSQCVHVIDLPEAGTCSDVVAARDACYADGTCRLAFEGRLLQSCKGLVPMWSYYSAEASGAP
jgi:hypothetical protein